MKIRHALSAAVPSALLTLALAAPALADGGVYHPGSASARDRLLAEPRPYPPNRVESPSRLENGRLWKTGDRYGARASRYGADPYDHPPVIYVRRDHQVIAINPWADLRGDSRIGFEDLERARQQWLREQGYVQSVRTHKNPRYLYGGRQLVSSDLPTPRATIERHIEKKEPQSPIAFGGSTTTDEIRARLAAKDEQDAETGETVADAGE